MMNGLLCKSVIVTIILLFLLENASSRRLKSRRFRKASLTSKPPLSGELVRLVQRNGEPVTSGIVEILSRDRLGVVCGQDWTLREADVICRQLGYVNGALDATSVTKLTTQHVSIGGIKCDEHAHTIQDCYWTSASSCGRNKVASVTCKANTGCPERWIAGKTSCYQLLPNMVTRRRHAIKKCASRGGHLVAIETKEENDLISHIFRNEVHGPVLTAGVKEGDVWFWEKVSFVNSTKHLDENIPEVRTEKIPAGEFKWFPDLSFMSKKQLKEELLMREQHVHEQEQVMRHQARRTENNNMQLPSRTPHHDLHIELGWVPGNISAEPTNKKKERCLFLSSLYEHPSGNDVNVNYHFWLDNRCDSTRRRMAGGFQYMCERPVQRTAEGIGCYRGIGNLYRGKAAYTEEGTRCMKWTDATDINPETYPHMGLGDHNYCRNPDNDDAPWCWISAGNFEFCDIPHCPDNHEEESIEQTEETCPEGEFMCTDGRCLVGSWVCDMETDCPGGEDEQQNCEYKLPLFKFSEGLTLREHRVEAYAGTTNETCAKYCLAAKRFVCRAFVFKERTRECLLTDMNSLLVDPRASRSDNIYELITQLDQCEDMYQCGNGRCVQLDYVCDGDDDCEDFTDEFECEAVSESVTVRLMDGTETEGRVEVHYMGEWGLVCDDQWDELDADVICRMLGFQGPSEALRASLFGQGSGSFLLDDVKCSGDETNIADCEHAGWKINNCYDWEQAAVRCSLRAVDVPVDISVKLEGGLVGNEGRVVLSRDGDDGTICDDRWGDNDAHVVCTMLGYTGGQAVDGDHFGPGDETLKIFLDEVQCNGNEDSVLDCEHVWLENDCEHEEDAGVICDPPVGAETSTSTTAPTSTTTRTSYRTTSISTMSPPIHTTPGNPRKTSTECVDSATVYIGKLYETESGFECQSWSLDTPHAHKHHDDSSFPDGSVAGAENFCRSPDDDPQPWCYSTDPDERWAYCDVPKCEENCYSHASDYTGPTSQTESGLTCQSWMENTPHEHKYHNTSNFPDNRMTSVGNKCRAPDGDTVPWCYTLDTTVRWQYCNVSKCAGGEFDFNVTCGIRPRETSNRRRRGAEVEDSDELWDFENDDNEEEFQYDPSLYKKMGRIFGGSEAVYGMYPWQAGVRRRLGGLLGWHMHHCGGTIIGEYWILSAAHCFRDMHRDNVIIRTGDHNNGFLDKHEQEFDVEVVISHEGYDPVSFDNDIALVKLKPNGGRGIIFNDYVQPACLPDEDTPYRWRQKCLISGWGEHEEDTQSEHLKAARVPLVDDATCRRLYKFEITSQMVCAGYLAGGTDSCTGDSGGPLVCDIDGRYTVMGATSFGEGCAVPNSPGVYARVTAFIPWIKEKLTEYS